MNDNQGQGQEGKLQQETENSNTCIIISLMVFEHANLLRYPARRAGYLTGTRNHKILSRAHRERVQERMERDKEREREDKSLASSIKMG